MCVARIFQRGGHTDSYIGYSPNCHLNIVGCLLTKRLTKGGSRAPQDPPWLRPCLRIIQECFQPKIGRKIIFSLGRKNKILIKQKRVYADFDFHRLSFHLQSECFCKTFVVTSQNQPKAAKTTQNHQQNQPKRPKTSHKT